MVAIGPLSHHLHRRSPVGLRGSPVQCIGLRLRQQAGAGGLALNAVRVVRTVRYPSMKYNMPVIGSECRGRAKADVASSTPKLVAEIAATYSGRLAPRPAWGQGRGRVTHQAAATISTPPSQPCSVRRAPSQITAISAPHNGSLPINNATRDGLVREAA